MFAYTGGLKGEQGIQGVQGDAGIQGIQGIQGVAGQSFASYFQAHRTEVQVIAEDTDTKVQFNVEGYDNNSEYDHVTNFEWKCKIAGKYTIKSIVGVQGLADQEGVSLIAILNDSSNIISDYFKTGSGGLATGKIDGDDVFAVDDTVHIEVSHNAGGNKNSGTIDTCNFSMHRVA